MIRPSLSDYISHPPGTYVAIGVVVVMMGIAFLPDMFAPKKKETPAPEGDTPNQEEETK